MLAVDRETIDEPEDWNDGQAAPVFLERAPLDEDAPRDALPSLHEANRAIADGGDHERRVPDEPPGLDLEPFHRKPMGV
jgi:hypothetical protein